MLINQLNVFGFRNLKDREFKFSDGVNIFVGANAQGKTNILEAIYVCAVGHSQRTRKDGELIAFGKKEGHLRLLSSKNGASDRIDIHLKINQKKGIALNGIPIKKYGELFGAVYVVIFSPEDLELIKAGPSARRRFMDFELCQTDPMYYYNLRQYNKILKQRNKLLKDAFKNPSLTDTLDVWDLQLARYGNDITAKRRAFAAALNDIIAQKHLDITGGKEKLTASYAPDTTEENFYNYLKNNIKKDIFAGNTSKGPHKDDLEFCVNGKNAGKFASQGQQRTAALSAKLSQVELIKRHTGESPILLLDDALSELDATRQELLFESIKDIQSFITCTGAENSLKTRAIKDNIFKIKNGEAVMV